MTQESPAPLTRRQLRERRTPAGRSTRARASGRRPVPPTVPAVGPGDQPLTRRAIREAERAACPPPFVALVRLPLAAVPRLGGGTLAKSGLLVALSGALVVTSVGGIETGPDAGLDGLALRAAADRAELERARALAAKERADSAAARRLSAAAVAYATHQRAEAVRVAEDALQTATAVSSEVEPLVDEATLTRLTTATAELEALVTQAQLPPVRPAKPAPYRVDAPPAPAPQSPAPSDVPVDASVTTVDSTATEEPAAHDPVATAASTDPSPETTDTPSSAAGRATARDDGAASRGAHRTAPEQQTSDTVGAPTATGHPGATSTGHVAPATQVDDDTTLLAAEATLALEHVDFLQEAAAGLEAVVAEVSEVAAAVEAQREAERKAAEERARKIAVAQESPNGAIPGDVLCAPTFAPDARLRCDAAEALDRLNAAYRAEHGRDLRVVSSYRSYSAQVSTRASRGSLAARPGTSNHGHGIAVDLGNFGSVGQFGHPNYRWMREHAAEFGWYHPAVMRPGGGGPQEPWHWEYGTG